MEIAEAPNQGSAFGRMFNTLAAPGEVFAEIKERPVAHSNWIVPAITWIFIVAPLVFLLFSQEGFQREMKKQTEKAFEKQVREGKMTQAQADQIQQNMPPWVLTIQKVVVVGATAVSAFVLPFFWGFIIWLFAVKVFGADIEYMKGVEAAGLAMIVYLLAAVVGGLVSLIMGKLITMSPALLLHDFDMTNRKHLMLAALNPFYFWFLAVVAVSISVLANVKLVKPLLWCFGLWILLRALFLSNQYTAGWAM